MLNFIRKHLIVVILVLLIIILIVLRIIYGGGGNGSQNEPIFVLTPAITAKPTIELSIDVAGSHPLYKVLPYKTSDFIIEGYIEPFVLSVRTVNKNKPKIEMENEVRQWIKDSGSDPNAHKIIWDWVDENQP